MKLIKIISLASILSYAVRSERNCVSKEYGGIQVFIPEKPINEILSALFPIIETSLINLKLTDYSGKKIINWSIESVQIMHLHLHHPITKYIPSSHHLIAYADINEIALSIKLKAAGYTINSIFTMDHGRLGVRLVPTNTCNYNIPLSIEAAKVMFHAESVTMHAPAPHNIANLALNFKRHFLPNLEELLAELIIKSANNMLIELWHQMMLYNSVRNIFRLHILTPSPLSVLRISTKPEKKVKSKAPTKIDDSKSESKNTPSIMANTKDTSVAPVTASSQPQTAIPNPQASSVSSDKNVQREEQKGEEASHRDEGIRLASDLGGEQPENEPEERLYLRLSLWPKLFLAEEKNNLLYENKDDYARALDFQEKKKEKGSTMVFEQRERSSAMREATESAESKVMDERWKTILEAGESISLSIPVPSSAHSENNANSLEERKEEEVFMKKAAKFYFFDEFRTFFKHFIKNINNNAFFNLKSSSFYRDDSYYSTFKNYYSDEKRIIPFAFTSKEESLNGMGKLQVLARLTRDSVVSSLPEDYLQALFPQSWESNEVKERAPQGIQNNQESEIKKRNQKIEEEIKDIIEIDRMTENVFSPATLYRTSFVETPYSNVKDRIPPVVNIRGGFNNMNPLSEEVIAKFLSRYFSLLHERDSLGNGHNDRLASIFKDKNKSIGRFGRNFWNQPIVDLYASFYPYHMFLSKKRSNVLGLAPKAAYDAPIFDSVKSINTFRPSKLYSLYSPFVTLHVADSDPNVNQRLMKKHIPMTQFSLSSHEEGESLNKPEEEKNSNEEEVEAIARDRKEDWYREELRNKESVLKQRRSNSVFLPHPLMVAFGYKHIYELFNSIYAVNKLPSFTKEKNIARDLDFLKLYRLMKSAPSNFDNYKPLSTFDEIRKKCAPLPITPSRRCVTDIKAALRTNTDNHILVVIDEEYLKHVLCVVQASNLATRDKVWMFQFPLKIPFRTQKHTHLRFRVASESMPNISINSDQGMSYKRKRVRVIDKRVVARLSKLNATLAENNENVRAPKEGSKPELYDWGNANRLLRNWNAFRLPFVQRFHWILMDETRMNLIFSNKIALLLSHAFTEKDITSLFENFDEFFMHQVPAIFASSRETYWHGKIAASSERWKFFSNVFDTTMAMISLKAAAAPNPNAKKVNIQVVHVSQPEEGANPTSLADSTTRVEELKTGSSSEGENASKSDESNDKNNMNVSIDKGDLVEIDSKNSKYAYINELTPDGGISVSTHVKAQVYFSRADITTLARELKINAEKEEKRRQSFIEKIRNFVHPPGRLGSLAAASRISPAEDIQGSSQQQHSGNKANDDYLIKKDGRGRSDNLGGMSKKEIASMVADPPPEGIFPLKDMEELDESIRMDTLKMIMAGRLEEEVLDEWIKSLRTNQEAEQRNSKAGKNEGPTATTAPESMLTDVGEFEYLLKSDLIDENSSDSILKSMKQILSLKCVYFLERQLPTYFHQNQASAPSKKSRVYQQYRQHCIEYLEKYFKPLLTSPVNPNDHSQPVSEKSASYLFKDTVSTPLPPEIDSFSSESSAKPDASKKTIFDDDTASPFVFTIEAFSRFSIAVVTNEAKEDITIQIFFHDDEINLEIIDGKMFKLSEFLVSGVTNLKHFFKDILSQYIGEIIYSNFQKVFSQSLSRLHNLPLLVEATSSSENCLFLRISANRKAGYVALHQKLLMENNFPEWICNLRGFLQNLTHVCSLESLFYKELNKSNLLSFLGVDPNVKSPLLDHIDDLMEEFKEEVVFLEQNRIYQVARAYFARSNKKLKDFRVIEPLSEEEGVDDLLADKLKGLEHLMTKPKRKRIIAKQRWVIARKMQERFRKILLTRLILPYSTVKKKSQSESREKESIWLKGNYYLNKRFLFSDEKEKREQMLKMQLRSLWESIFKNRAEYVPNNMDSFYNSRISHQKMLLRSFQLPRYNLPFSDAIEIFVELYPFMKWVKQKGEGFFNSLLEYRPASESFKYYTQKNETFEELLTNFNSSSMVPGIFLNDPRDQENISLFKQIPSMHEMDVYKSFE